MADDKWLKDQLTNLNVDFDAADTDKSGSLSIREVQGVLRASGFTGDAAAANTIFFDLDKNKDFRVTRDEFQKVMSNLPKASKREMSLRREFERLDSDKSGSLSRRELMDCLINGGTTYVAREVVDKIMAYTFTDDDGVVSYDEFLRLVNFEESESELKKIFSQIDKDRSGELSAQEMLDAINSDGELARLRPQISRVFNDYVGDFRPDKKVDFNRFVSVWMNKRDAIRAEDTSSNPYI